MDKINFLKEIIKDIESFIQENGDIEKEEIEDIINFQYELLYDYDTWGTISCHNATNVIKEDLKKHLEKYNYDEKLELYY